MDLRRRLAGMLALLLGSLFALTAIIQLYSLRADIEAEVAASVRLVNVLAAAGAPPPLAGPPLAQRLAEARLRHLSVRTADQPAANATPHPVLAWLGLAPPAQGERAIHIGGQTLYITPNPRSEIDERLAATVRIWSTLLFISGTAFLVTWWCTDRALAPVRQLEDSLHRLARSEPVPRLPAFALREFGRVARAIDHLARALAEARAGQHELARQLIAVQEDERRALARELHDEMGQTLTALNVTATHLARNAEGLAPAAVAECALDLRRDLRTCGEQLRTMLRALRPHGLHASGLAQTLHELVQGWRGRQTAIAFALDLPRELPDMGDAMALTLYRVVQEALTNAVRHSGARHCTVRLSGGAGTLVLEVRDDGRGLPAGPRWHGGLLGMRERVAMLDGQLQALPNPGGGLLLRATFPLACGVAPATEPAEVPA
ncbi:two-component system sensor histidine kinase UhpB [Pseudoduganella lurida]|uniref:histidine kinase n=1 Tax=Pseudoduganella lurida TaxID=1036180 RepID=A0A562R2K9_9BURK|nr:sensor histidine kinase [Pseudoduganella lurida]TWI62616.1 two-component system sensor histidine kinase UhpB [Pseudoduganella lurida]